MFYYILLIFFFLFLITKNIILLNEESLILICFYTFCWLCYTNVGDSIGSMFDAKGEKTGTEINNSVKILINHLKQKFNHAKTICGCIYAV